jgi:putative ABC transport system substrate-binding protein
MDRRAFISAAGANLLAILLHAEAQTAERVYQVGFVTLGAPPPRRSRLLDAFIDAMRDRSYVEGRNLVIRGAFANGEVDRLNLLVANLVQAKVDVILTTSSAETLAAKRATSTIPIVMTLAPDPVEQGLVASLARPGGNVTGLTNLSRGISQKYVELLRQAVPSATRFVVVGGPGAPFPEIRRELHAAARQLGLTVTFIEVKSPDDFGPALARAKSDGAAGIIVALDILTYVHRRKLVESALGHGLPGIYWVRDYVEDGGLMSYGVSFAEQGRRAAYFVDRLAERCETCRLTCRATNELRVADQLEDRASTRLDHPPFAPTASG